MIAKLGKEYAAHAWEEWFKNRPPEPEQSEAPAMTYVPTLLPGPWEPSVSLPGPDGEPTLVEQAVLEGLDVFGTLFELEYEQHEYIDPEFRLLHRKKRKKKQRRPRF